MKSSKNRICPACGHKENMYTYFCTACGEKTVEDNTQSVEYKESDNKSVNYPAPPYIERTDRTIDEQNPQQIVESYNVNSQMMQKENYTENLGFSKPVTNNKMRKIKNIPVIKGIIGVAIIIIVFLLFITITLTINRSVFHKSAAIKQESGSSNLEVATTEIIDDNDLMDTASNVDDSLEVDSIVDEAETVDNNTTDIDNQDEIQVEAEVLEEEIDSEFTSSDSEIGIHVYELVVDDVTWTEAYNDCLSRGGILVHINSQDEYDAILKQIYEEEKDNIKFWLGGTRYTHMSEESEEYKWIDTKGLSQDIVLNGNEYISYWMADEPSYYDYTTETEEAYMNMFYYKSEGRWVWNDVPDDIITAVGLYTGTIGYICEYEN